MVRQNLVGTSKLFIEASVCLVVGCRYYWFCGGAGASPGAVAAGASAASAAMT